MSFESFAGRIAAEWQELSPEARIERVRKLVQESENNRQFMQKYFPKEYAEAFPPSVRGVGGLTVSGQRRELHATPSSDRDQ